MRRSLVAVLAAATLGAGCAGGAASPLPTDGWRTAAIHDVVGGSTFRIADLHGHLVALETMALWCVNCRVQQQQAQAALAAVASPDLVYISLDVDHNEHESDLAAYARQSGFDWRFAVVSPDLARSLASAFGDEILSPPSTPFVLIGVDGNVVTKHLGIQGSGELTSLLRAHLP